MSFAAIRRASASAARRVVGAARSRHPAWRVARALVIAIVSTYVLYLGVANGLLYARVLPSHLDDVEGEVRIDYTSAWTFWPGRISVESLRVASQDSRIETEIRARRASARVSILPFFDKTVELSGIRAEGVSLRARGRRAESEALADQAALPPMVTWGALALAPPGPRPASDPEELWRIILDDAAGSVDELWVEGMRVTGEDIRVRGSFDFRPLVNVTVRDVRGVVRGGRVEAMGEAEPLLAEGIDGAFRFHVPEFDVPSHTLPEIMVFADVDLEATGLLQGGHVAAAVQDEVVVTDGSGAFDARFAARQGRLSRGSRITYDTARVGIQKGPLRVDLIDVGIVGRATSDEDVDLGVGAASADLGLSSASALRVHVEAPSASVKAAMTPTFMQPALVGGEASIPAANIDLDGAVLGVAIGGRATSAIQLEEIRMGEEASIRSRGFLTFDDIAMTAGDERVRGWWGRLEVGSQLARKGDAPWSVDAKVLGRLRDARPAVAILDGGDFLPGIVADQLTADGLVVEGAIQKRGDRTQIDVADATGDGLRVRGRMVSTTEEMRASYLVQTSLIDVGVSLVGGGTQVQLLAGNGWLERERGLLRDFGWGGRAVSTERN